MLELTVLPTSLELIKEVDYCDAFIVGEKGYALRMPHYFSFDEIREIVTLCQRRNQKVYVAVNKILHEEDLGNVKSYLHKLSMLNIDGIIFGDLGVYNIGRDLGLVSKLIYNPETYITNYESTAIYLRKGIKRVSIAKEITLKDIIEIAKRNPQKIEILGHGAVNMFHSMRDLVSNYFRFLKSDNPEENRNRELYLVEEKREEKYPIFEDENGTHVFSGFDLCTVSYLDDFVENGVGSIRIDGLFMKDSVLKEIIKVYRQAITDFYYDKDLYRVKKQEYIITLQNIEGIRQFYEGFLFKKTIYKGEENERNS